MNEFERADHFYNSLGTIRFHNKVKIPSQTNKDHTMGMLLLCEALHPNPSANLLRAIIRHDMAESIGCDFPHEMKKEFPVLKEIDVLKQEAFEKSYNQTPLELTIEEQLWLKYLDQIEVLYYLTNLTVPPNEQSKVIYKNCTVILNDLENQLKTFGFFTNPEETVH